MNRRSLLKGFAAGVAGLMVPVGVAEAAEEVSRRYWSLGAMPDDCGWPEWCQRLQAHREQAFAQWVEAMEPRHYPITDLVPRNMDVGPYDQVTYEWGQSYYPLYDGSRVTIYGHEPYSDRFMNMGRREVLSNE
jgi:hypothetical protein